MLVRSYSSQDELNRKVKMCHKGYMIPRNQRNFGVFGLERRFSTIIFTELGYRWYPILSKLQLSLVNK